MLIQTSGGQVVGGGANEHWFRAVNHFAGGSGWLHTPARLYADYGVVIFAAVLLVSWWLARRDGDLRRVAVALWAPIAALLALGVNQFLVAGVAEPRPYWVLPHTLVLVSRSSDYSFPSDHAVMAGAVAAGVLLAERRLGMLAAALAVLMACTRVYVGAHFPLDVVAGLLVGGATSYASCLLVSPAITWLVKGLAGTPVRPLLTRVQHQG